MGIELTTPTYGLPLIELCFMLHFTFWTWIIYRLNKA